MVKALWQRIKLLLLLVLLMLSVHGVNIALDGQLNQYGIVPRSVQHWWHIFSSPFLHGDLVHLLNNMVGLLIFGGICLLRSRLFFTGASIFIIAAGGGLVWLFARSAIHIGASGWIFGLWSLTMAMAWFDRSVVNVAVALLVLFFYGGMIYGVLPSDPRVSFEAHLFGAGAGVVYAFLYVLCNRPKKRQGKQ